MWSWYDGVSSTCLISLIWVNSPRCQLTCLPNLVVIALMGMEISVLISVLTLIPCFQNQKYRFTIPKSRTRLAEKREEEEHRQLYSVLRFTQTQQLNLNLANVPNTDLLTHFEWLTNSYLWTSHTAGTRLQFNVVLNFPWDFVNS